MKYGVTTCDDFLVVLANSARMKRIIKTFQEAEGGYLRFSEISQIEMYIENFLTEEFSKHGISYNDSIFQWAKESMLADLFLQLENSGELIDEKFLQRLKDGGDLDLPDFKVICEFSKSCMKYLSDYCVEV